MKKNYRPVSILTGLSKIFESCINDQLTSHFLAIFNDLVSAFRKGYSCQTLLVKVIDDWKIALDHNNYVGALFMDLSKAFDCLPHALLISKLNAYGVGDGFCQLLTSYLTSRKQRVKIGQYRSSWNLITKGVPQGSILGPLLFNVFINDLFLFIEKCQLYNYADDNSMSSTAPCLADAIQNLQYDTKNAINWFVNNGMEPNPSKFQFMVISTHPIEHVTLQINEDISLQAVDEVVMLGITIDCKLNFRSHVDTIIKKAARQLNALSRISRYLDSKSKNTINNCYVLSNFNYSPLVWHFCGKIASNKLEKLHERSLRIVLKNYVSTYAELLEEADSVSLLTMRLRALLIEMFKYTKGINPACLGNLFRLKHNNHNLRDNEKFIQPLRKTSTYGLRSVSYVGPKIWNNLPSCFKRVNDMNLIEFKRLIANWKFVSDELFVSYV